jgi:hypothetical protein
LVSVDQVLADLVAEESANARHKFKAAGPGSGGLKANTQLKP